jgi:hypothetical protein
VIFTAAGGDIATHRYAVLYSDTSTGDKLIGYVFNVKDFGARPSNRLGGPDCSTAINDAVNAAVASGGGIIFFPPGYYEVTSSIYVPPSAAGLRFVGSGVGSDADRGSTICGNLQDYLLRIDWNSNYPVRSIEFLGFKHYGNHTINCTTPQTIQPVRDRGNRPPITTMSCFHRSSDQITYIITLSWYLPATI